jgi:predicted deacylase
MARKQLSGWMMGIWVANVLICLVAAGLYAWYNGPVPAEAGHPAGDVSPLPPRKTLTPKPSITPVPPPTQRPTITLWPTPSPGPSLTAMSSAQPANMQVIGYSVEKRALEVFRYGKGRVRKLIVAGIHGGYEWNTIALADELIAYLNDHPERIPDNTTLYILHDLNPDGLARGKTPDGRANANNVDMNHNWPYNWAADWSRNGCFNERILGGGSGPGSEPEVKALIMFINQIRPVALISYHSAALGIFPGGKPDFPPSKKLAKAVAEVSDYPYPPLNTGCDYTGNMTDWAANTQGIPALDIELTNHRDTDFDQNLRILQVFLDWAPDKKTSR